MAAVSRYPNVQSPFETMNSKRTPLADNPNAANSPLRHNTVGKRTRADPTEEKDFQHGQSPSKKRQLVDFRQARFVRTENNQIDERDGRIFNSRTTNSAQPNAPRRVIGNRDIRQKEQQHAVSKEKERREQTADAETIKQWRKHYKKVFPQFVFFFESLPQDVCLRSSRQVMQLGAREEKFFSKGVTHIVTARPIPPPPQANQATSCKGDLTRINATHATQTRTINPTLLEIGVGAERRGNAIDSLPSRRTQPTAQESNEQKRQQPGSADILVKAREMNIKIWALEKFERMMQTLFNSDWSDSNEGPTTRNITTTGKQEPDLKQLLRNEKEQPTERPPWSDVLHFRGPYIYIHDMDEKTKPVLHREYPNPERKEEGEWPQLRGAPLPRCPFIVEEPPVLKREESTKQKKEEAQPQKRIPERPPLTRAASAAMEGTKPKPPCEPVRSLSVHEPSNTNSVHRAIADPKHIPPSTKTFEPPQLKPTPTFSGNTTDNSLPPQLANRFQHLQSLNGRPLNAGREPLASGLQRSNQTSAIKSTMISSTAANPATARAGTSKEMHQLQRRAVEQRRSGLSANSVNSVPSSYNEIRAAINGEQKSQPGTLKRTTSSMRRADAPMPQIHEDETLSGEDSEEKYASERSVAKLTNAPRKKQATGNVTNAKERDKRFVKKVGKPGYCENCRDKYEDFYEHIESRKHRKFATSSEGWEELDALLRKLVRR